MRAPVAQDIIDVLGRCKVASAQELADLVHVALRTAQHHLRALVADGTVHRQPGRPCRYALDPRYFLTVLPRRA